MFRSGQIGFSAKYYFCHFFKIFQIAKEVSAFTIHKL